MRLEWLYWFSWFAFLLSACVIIVGSLMALKHGVDLRNYSLVGGGFMSLALSGFLMAIACDVLKGG